MVRDGCNFTLVHYKILNSRYLIKCLVSSMALLLFRLDIIQMTKYLILSVFAFISLIVAQPASDLVNNPPGMPNISALYSGYLSTTSDTRKIHYIFIQSESATAATDPLVLWLNGGPGCSSLAGMFQELGPYFIPENYVKDQNLTRNPNSWTRNANMLFFESPAGVGFSTNSQSNYTYTDDNTADDAYAALSDFYSKSNFTQNDFFITGESYAGKYIPDLASRILSRTNAIKLKGILVGNGVMNFVNDQLEKSSIQYLVEHDFIGPHLQQIYKTACPKDFMSPRCRFFQYQFNTIRRTFNPYNVYEICTHATSQGSVLKHFVQNMKTIKDHPILNAIDKCPSDDGLITYLNTYKTQFNIKSDANWTVCSHILYHITPQGSINQYKTILLNPSVKVWMFNGDWDDVVPFCDTLKNMKLINQRAVKDWTPWFLGEEHAGFYQLYQGLTLITVKGAGHMVPQNKGGPSFQMFYNFIKNRPINTPVDP